MLSDASYAHSAIGEAVIKDELENGNHCGSTTALFQVLSCANVWVSWHLTEEQELVKELVALSTPERVRAIRDLPRSFEEKKIIRWVSTGKD